MPLSGGSSTSNHRLSWSGLPRILHSSHYILRSRFQVSRRPIQLFRWCSINSSPLDIRDTETDDKTSAVGEEAVPFPQVPLSESQIITTAPTPVVPTPVSSQREPEVKSRPKMTYVDKVSDISTAQGFLPEDKYSLHNTGIPPTYAVRHSGTSSKGRSLYLCPFGDQCSHPPYSSDIASTGSHVHHHHLGHCIQCPYDGNCF